MFDEFVSKIDIGCEIVSKIDNGKLKKDNTYKVTDIKYLGYDMIINVELDENIIKEENFAGFSYTTCFYSDRELLNKKLKKIGKN